MMPFMGMGQMGMSNSGMDMGGLMSLLKMLQGIGGQSTQPDQQRLQQIMGMSTNGLGQTPMNITHTRDIYLKPRTPTMMPWGQSY